MPKIGRNSLCPCGSGLKYKNRCLSKDEERAREENERGNRWAESVIGGSATIFRQAIDRAYETARKNRKARKHPAKS
jgi:hypothetical protein